MCSRPSCDKCFGGGCQVDAHSDALIGPIVRCLYAAQLLVRRTGMVDGHIVVVIFKGKDGGRVQVGDVRYKVKRHGDPTGGPAERRLPEVTADLKRALVDMLDHVSLQLAGARLPFTYGRFRVTVRDGSVRDVVLANRIRPSEVPGLEPLASCMAAAWKPGESCRAVCC